MKRWWSFDWRWRPAYLPTAGATRVERIIDCIWQWSGWYPVNDLLSWLHRRRRSG